MADQFSIQNSIPDPATQDDFEKTMRTMIPTNAVVDTDLMKVADGLILINSLIPRIRKVTITYEDFTVAGLTESITAQATSAGEIILKSALDVTEKWEISGMSTFDLELGISGTADKYSGSTHVDAEAISRGNAFGPVVDDGLESMTAATNILLTGTSDAGNLNTASAGSVDVYLLVVGTILS